MRYIKYSAILFDFDGTLADTKEDVWLSLEYAASQFGCSIPAEVRMNPSNLGRPIEELFKSIVQGSLKEDIETFDANVSYHYRNLNRFENTEFYSGIKTLLEQCTEKGLSCFIVTNKPAVPLKRILRIKGWESYFKGFICPDSIRGKLLNKTEMIRYMLHYFLQDDSTVYIGDTYSDIIAARQNQLDSVGVLYGDGDPALVKAENPDYLVTDPTEISDILFHQN